MTTSPTPALLQHRFALYACAVLAPLTGCSESPKALAPQAPAEKPTPSGAAGEPKPAVSTIGVAGEAYKDAPTPEVIESNQDARVVSFSSQAEAAGISVQNWNGSWRDRKFSILESIGQGAAWLDDDSDGLLDLYLPNGSSLDELPSPAPTSHFFTNNGDGTFRDVSVESGLDSAAWNNGVAAADFDNDGDTDLFVSNWGDHSLYQSDGKGHFTDIAATAGLAKVDVKLTAWGVCAAWGDVDLDGHLDLFVGHYLGFDPKNPPHGGETQHWKGMRDAYYGPSGLDVQRDFLFRNNGDGTFRDGSEEAGLNGVEAGYTLGAIFLDHNLDGNPDLYVAVDSQPNYLFVGDGTGKMDERATLTGLAYGEQGNAQAGMGIDAADYDADGDDDLVVTNFDDDVNTLYRNDGRTFRDQTVRIGLAGPTRNVLSWGVGFQDFDLDADLDLFIACGHVYPSAETDDPNTKYRQANQFYLRDGKRLRLLEEGGDGLEVRAVTRGAAFGDYDADGDVDIIGINLNEPPTLYRNDTETDGHWFAVKLIGDVMAGTNRDGIGARVIVHAGELTRSAERRAGASFLSTNSPWLHFGLGGETKVEKVEVVWPGGKRSEYGPFEVGNRVVLEQ
jgi:enediyne biosynthesis protein E4